MMEAKEGYDGLRAGAEPGRWSRRQEKVDAQTLTIEGHSVMEAWEIPYMKAFAALVTRKGGRILECGFGMGLSASAIQAYAPDEHTIVEVNENVFQRLREFARRAEHKVTPVLGFAAEAVRDFPAESFDGIFYDTYPLNAEEQHTHQFAFAAAAYRALKPGGVLTYCNLTSTGVLRNEHDSWQSVFKKTQVPRLLAAGVPADDIQGIDVYPIDPPPSCRYFQHRTAMIPIIVKAEKNGG